MTIAYSYNGGSEIPGVVSDWQRIPQRQTASGTTVFTSLAINMWQIPQMTDTDFEALQALIGTVLTSLETNNINDRNTGATYLDSVILRALSGQQMGHIVTGVAAEFEVQIS